MPAISQLQSRNDADAGGAPPMLLTIDAQHQRSVDKAPSQEQNARNDLAVQSPSLSPSSSSSSSPSLSPSSAPSPWRIAGRAEQAGAVQLPPPSRHLLSLPSASNGGSEDHDAQRRRAPQIYETPEETLCYIPPGMYVSAEEFDFELDIELALASRSPPARLPPPAMAHR